MALAVRILLIFGSLAVYIALAVIASGGVDAFFSVPAHTALVVATVAIGVASVFAGGNLSAGVREDRGNRWVIAALGAISILLAFVPAWTERRDLWLIDGDAVRWLGVVVATAGSALRLWAVFVLGDRFSGLVAIQPGHALVTTGVYRIIRHPSYLGLLLGSVGWALAFRSALGVVLALASLVPVVARIRSEERLLASEFGEEYRAYRARTSRLVPGVY